MASVPELLLANYISAQSRALTLMNLWLLEEEETEEESEEEEDEDLHCSFFSCVWQKFEMPPPSSWLG